VSKKPAIPKEQLPKEADQRELKLDEVGSPEELHKALKPFLDDGYTAKFAKRIKGRGGKIGATFDPDGGGKITPFVGLEGKEKEWTLTLSRPEGQAPAPEQEDAPPVIDVTPVDDDVEDAIESLQKENEELQAQNEELRKRLEKVEAALLKKEKQSP